MIVLDTSGILALLDADDGGHSPCVDALEAAHPPFVVPAGILGEVGYLIEVKLGSAAVSGFVADLHTRAFALDSGDDDLGAIVELLRRYADLSLGLADASVIACAERRRAPVLTLDFRDFGPLAREGHIELALSG